MFWATDAPCMPDAAVTRFLRALLVLKIASCVYRPRWKLWKKWSGLGE